VEGDDRTPSGVFTLGPAYGYAPAPPPGATWPYEVVGPRDLLVEDPRSPLYNTHLEVPGDRPLLAWEAEAVMLQDVAAHALKVFVAHNAPPDVVPGAGSAIFLHAWRADGVDATAGCTSMARERLEEVVTWLEPGARPVYVVLHEGAVEALREPWGLPRGP
jgi:L,D-peptidoglycan transpeptidase YkuD (ErfK/YbiS/YcfS/YnhG family)